MKFYEILKNEFFSQNIFKKEQEKPENLDYTNLYIHFLVPFHLEKVANFKFSIKI